MELSCARRWVAFATTRGEDAPWSAAAVGCWASPYARRCPHPGRAENVRHPVSPRHVVCVDCAGLRARAGGWHGASLAFDWGLETFATLATEDGSPQHSENPRFVRRSAAKLTDAYRTRDTKQKFSRGWWLTNKKVAQLHSKIARQRLDFHHQQSAQLVGTARAVFTETLHVVHMLQHPEDQAGCHYRAVSAQ